jgi:hypothetical protein
MYTAITAEGSSNSSLELTGPAPEFKPAVRRGEGRGLPEKLDFDVIHAFGEVPSKDPLFVREQSIVRDPDLVLVWALKRMGIFPDDLTGLVQATELDPECPRGNFAWKLMTADIFDFDSDLSIPQVTIPPDGPFDHRLVVTAGKAVVESDLAPFLGDASQDRL